MISIDQSLQAKQAFSYRHELRVLEYFLLDDVIRALRDYLAVKLQLAEDY